MSSFLYRLGRACATHGRRVLLGWLLALAVLGGLAATVGGTYSDSFAIPGAPSQAALDKLHLTFPDAAATSANALVEVPAGHRVTDPDVRRAVEAAVRIFAKDPVVSRATSPYGTLVKGLLSKDGRAAMVQLQLTGSVEQVTDADRARLTALAAQAQKALPAGSRMVMGGPAYSIEVPTLSATEGAGLVVALVVLFVTLGSILAAGLPLLTAVVGVGISMTLIMLAARLATINSTTPLLAVMLGLAVGIDYALFILSRHREQLRGRDGAAPMEVVESIAQAVATAGSAVVFAGLTVCIALVGLAIARIPFLTVMGVFAAVAVALAVCIALTALPALMGLLGERMRPRSKRRRRTPSRPRRSVFDWWVGVATRFPLVTVVVVAALLGALSAPAAGLRLSLPNSGQHAVTAPDRITYDLVTQHFGPGYNGMLIVTADLLGSNDPMGVMARLKTDVEAVPGVETVLVATPNRNADTGIVQVVPTTGPDDPATATLVQRLVAQHDVWQRQLGTNTAVTGATAVQIDVSQRLAGALLPFGLFVVGLSFVLLMMVFRSVAVPLKATVGYLLSVGAAFGATQLVFNRGWGHQLINLERGMPIISFMPIIIMGILFGLAMDYEVFLVSRMREDYVHGLRRDPSADPDAVARGAVRSGFDGSAVVVTAAAVIMFAVFAFFVPEGMGPIKQIAFGLAVGVAADAFAVRMTMVPAIMQLLGARAWRLPGWLDRMLPSLDVEGEGLHQELELAAWPTAEHTEALHAEGLSVDGLVEPLDLRLEPGDVVVLQGPADRGRAALLALSGRLTTDAGRARVAGALLPLQASRVRAATALLAPGPQFASRLSAAEAAGCRLVLVEGMDALSGPDHDALLAAVREARRHHTSAWLLAAAPATRLDDIEPDQVVQLTAAPSVHHPEGARPDAVERPTTPHATLTESL